MKIISTFFFIIVVLLSFLYLLLPDPEFPPQLPDSIVSQEPADEETPLRRGYFTNLTREEVVTHYRKEFDKPTFQGISFFSLRLNYPPEEAQVRVRDQTSSTFLEEIAHPFRESIYINGNEPKDTNTPLIVEGKAWRQKIIVRHIPSSLPLRLAIAAFAFLLAYLLGKAFVKLIKHG